MLMRRNVVVWLYCLLVDVVRHTWHLQLHQAASFTNYRSCVQFSDLFQLMAWHSRACVSHKLSGFEYCNAVLRQVCHYQLSAVALVAIDVY